MIHPDALYALPSHIHTRWASAENFAAEKGGACRNDDGRKRSPSFPLAAGEARTLLDIKGTTGVVRRIWITINDRSAKMLRGIRIDAFWDGADTPAVSAPLADFFSLGLGRMATFQSALFSSPEGRSFNCYIPMPVRKAARIVARNVPSRLRTPAARRGPRPLPRLQCGRDPRQSHLLQIMVG